VLLFSRPGAGSGFEMERSRDRSEGQVPAGDEVHPDILLTDERGRVVLAWADAKNADINFRSNRVSADHKRLMTCYASKHPAVLGEQAFSNKLSSCCSHAMDFLVVLS
jgi:hypothetical protein